MEDMIRLLAAELGQKPQHVGAVVRLLDEGNTIPFIARYRKEQHGAMDDTTLRTLAERLQYLRNLDQRREEIRRSIAAQEKLTDELDAALQAAVTLSELEDLYRPYKPKRRTRATVSVRRRLMRSCVSGSAHFRIAGKRPKSGGMRASASHDPAEASASSSRRLACSTGT